MVAPDPSIRFIALTAILAIAVGAGASGALNMWYDADIDALMTRTAEPADPARPDQADRGAAFGWCCPSSR
jgi:protoheme IX farnesyltransferase